LTFALAALVVVMILLSYQFPLIAVAVLILVLYVEKRLRPIARMLGENSRALNTLIEFNEALLIIHISRGLVTDAEFRALSALLTAERPPHGGRYYTEEVYDKLGEILKKGPDEITWDDVFELERIYDLLLKEASESGREELARYAAKLRVFIAMAKGFLLKRGVLPVSP